MKEPVVHQPSEKVAQAEVSGSSGHPPFDLTHRQMLTAGDVARLFGVSLKTVGRWASEGRIRSIRTPGGHRRFWAEDVAEVVAQPQASSER